MEIMNISIERRGESAIINVMGDFHLYNITDFKKTLLDMIYSDYRRVVIDMGNLGYFDSSFIGALIFAGKKMKEGNRELSLMNLGAEASTMLRIINLEKDFKVYASPQQFLQ